MTKDWDEMLSALAEPGQPMPGFAVLQRIAQRNVGARIFTVMVRDNAANVQRRLHSSHPIEYPVSGFKPQTPGRWQDQVVGRREAFVANTIEEIAEVFPDHELIKSLGCQSVVNVPIIFDNAVIGTLNLLEAAGHYTSERVAAAMELRPFGAAAMLAAQAVELSTAR
ncbi:MAG: GAF domain-containing protein [Propylenella sp.]